MVYYTAKFRNSFPNVKAMNTYIDLVFLEANQGYENSNVPIIIVVHCKELISIRDYESLTSRDALANFGIDVGTKSVDTASLWTETFDMVSSTACASGYVDVARDCRWAYSVVNKGCALLGYGFAHELGHNLGSRHNIEQYVNVDDHSISYAHGFLIAEDPSVPNRVPGQPSIGWLPHHHGLSEIIPF